MKLKEYIDQCTWEELKTTKGVKEYMQRSLADLKRLEPKYTDETAKYTIHFSENSKDEDNDSDEAFVKYDASLRKVDHKGNIGVFESAWDEMLPLEVVIKKEQKLTDTEIVAAVIWELTWNGATFEECKRAWDEWRKVVEKLMEDDFIPLEKMLEEIEPDNEEKT
jgi:hypothetical protein